MIRINRKCPFCSETNFGVEKWNTNLYLLKCLNENTASAQWAKLKPNGRFKLIATQSPKTPNRMRSYDQQQFNKMQIPYWKLMGQKPKAKDIAYEKELKRRGMNYGDAVLERSMHADNPSALPQWQQAFEGKGDNAPQYQKS